MSTAALSRWDRLADAGRKLFVQGDDAGAAETRRTPIGEAARGGGDPLRVAANLESLAELKHRQRDLAAAEALYRSALVLRDDAVGESGPGAMPTLDRIAALCAARGAHDEAEAFLARALAAVDGPGGDQRDVAARLSTLAAFHVERGAHAAAEPLLQRLLGLSQAVGRTNAEVAATLTTLAEVHAALGRHDSAEQLLRRALAVAGMDRVLQRLADEVAAQGRDREAMGIRGGDGQPHAPAESRPYDRPLPALQPGADGVPGAAPHRAPADAETSRDPGSWPRPAAGDGDVDFFLVPAPADPGVRADHAFGARFRVVAVGALVVALALLAVNVAARSGRGGDGAVAASGAAVAGGGVSPADHAALPTSDRSRDGVRSSIDTARTVGDSERVAPPVARRARSESDDRGEAAMVSAAPTVLPIDTRVLDDSVQARIESAVRGPVVTLPAITPTGRPLPPIDGRRFDGRLVDTPRSNKPPPR